MKNMKMTNINYFNKTKLNTEDYEKLGTSITNKAAEVMNVQDKEIRFIFLDNDEIQSMNKNYREKDYATDVLTFVGEDNYLGDIFISLEKVKEQAQEIKHSFEKEWSFMFVTGFLHSIGYDHETDSDHKIMFDLQDKILEEVDE